jgi:3',5'-cyclic AMP phosphodiesterase CpdA
MDSGHDFVLAHISDLHFSQGTDQSNPNHAHSIKHLIGLQNRLAAIGNVDSLIVSGDVSNHGDRQSLLNANAWLFKTLSIGDGQYTGLNMPIERVRIVPGNHDAWNGAKFGPLIDRRQQSLKHYNFAFPQYQIPHGGCYFDWQQKGDNGLYIALIDSCFLGDTEQHAESTFGTLRFDQAVAKGRLTVEQAEQLLEWHDKGIQGRLENPREPGTYIDRSVFATSLKVLVMHHYLFEPPEKKSDYFMRVQHRDIVFRNIALSDFDILMCGHKHVAAFDVHDYGDHFDERAVNRYMTNYFRRLIGLESLPIQFVDEKGRRLSKALTQLAEIIGNYFKRAKLLLTAAQPETDDSEISEKVFQLLKNGLENPENLRRTVAKFLHEVGPTGASVLEPTEVKAIQKRISVGLGAQERKDLRKVADNISALSLALKERQFLQLMAGSSAKASNTPEQKRSFHIYKIRRNNDGWNLICERYKWDVDAFSNTPTSREHHFSRKV